MAMINLEKINVKRQDKFLLQDVSWSTKSGEQWALLGANGAGKTTLLQVILGYLWPTSGSVSVFDKKYGEVDLRELRKQIGFVSVQMDVRLEGSGKALELVESGKTASYQLYEELLPEDRERALHLLEEVGAGAIREKAYHLLSQGERQKVLIARALMASPRLLVLDEPCTGLDFPTRENLLATIEQMTRQEERQLLYVTHYPEEITAGFTHVAVLRQGQLVAAGPKQDVLCDDVLGRAYDTPVQVRWLDERPVVRIRK